jgi:hypothetical protein
MAKRRIIFQDHTSNVEEREELYANEDIVFGFCGARRGSFPIVMY